MFDKIAAHEKVSSVLILFFHVSLQTLSQRDIEYHLSAGEALFLNELRNGSRIRTKVGSLRVIGVSDLLNPAALVRYCSIWTAEGTESCWPCSWYLLLSCNYFVFAVVSLHQWPFCHHLRHHCLQRNHTRPAGTSDGSASSSAGEWCHD